MKRCKHCDRPITPNPQRGKGWEHNGYRVFCDNGETKAEPKVLL